MDNPATSQHGALHPILPTQGASQPIPQKLCCFSLLAFAYDPLFTGMPASKPHLLQEAFLSPPDLRDLRLLESSQSYLATLLSASEQGYE